MEDEKRTYKLDNMLPIADLTTNRILVDPNSIHDLTKCPKFPDLDDVEQINTSHGEVRTDVSVEYESCALHLSVKYVRDLGESINIYSRKREDSRLEKEKRTRGMHTPHPVPTLVFFLRSPIVVQSPPLTHLTMLPFDTF